MKKKKAFTLLEIMIVIFLIGIIGSVIGYNMKGSLDEGKAFRTKQAMIKVRDLLELEIAKTSPKLEEVQADPAKYLQQSGIAKNPKKLLKDGWGGALVVTVDANGDVSLSSAKYDAYKQKKGIVDDDED